MTLPPNVDDVMPLSPMQHLMLLHALATDGNGTLLNQVCYEIRGALDVAVFRRALEALPVRHSALRAAFVWEGLAQPLQVIRTAVVVPYRFIDVSEHPPERQADLVEELRRGDAEMPMVLGRAPLMRCTLVRCAEGHHRFFWSLMHLVVDRWSYAVLVDELRALYTAYHHGTEPALPVSAQYRDYVAWIGRQDRAAAERFWRDELAGFIEPSHLRTREGASGARATTRRGLSPELTAQVRARAAQWRTTPAGLMLAAIGALLARCTGRHEVLYGVTVSGRPPELDSATQAVGSFMANLPARIACPADSPIGEWVRAVQRAQVRRQAFAHVSPADIVAWSAVPPGQALYDTLVLINVEEAHPIAWPGLTMEATSATLDAGVPLLIAVLLGRSQLELSLVHELGTADAEDILRELEAILTQLVMSDAEATVGDLLATGNSHRSSPRPGALSPTIRQGWASGDDDLAGELLRIWRAILGTDAIGLDDDFLAVGGSSLQAAQLFAQMEPVLGRPLPLSTLFEAGSIRAILARVDHPLPRRRALVGIRSSGRCPPLAIVPGISGNVVGLFALARALGPSHPVIAFEAPGLDGREAPLPSIEAIAARYVEELLAEDVPPCHLLGICFGATVALEMAIRLRTLGRPPASLILLDPAALLRDTQGRLPGGAGSFIRGRLDLYWDEFRSATWTERGRLLGRKAQRAVAVLTDKATRVETETELNQAKVTAANTLAVTRYLPRRHEGRAHVFRTSDRDLGGTPDPRDEWRNLITPEPDFTWVGGASSGEVLLPPNVAGFAAGLATWMTSGQGPVAR